MSKRSEKFHEKATFPMVFRSLYFSRLLENIFEKLALTAPAVFDALSKKKKYAYIAWDLLEKFG